MHLLSEQKIDVIYSEFFFIPHYEGAPLFYRIWEFLEKTGYDPYDLFKGSYGINGQLRFGDAIFISRKFRAAFIDTYPEEP